MNNGGMAWFWMAAAALFCRCSVGTVGFCTFVLSSTWYTLPVLLLVRSVFAAALDDLLPSCSVAGVHFCSFLRTRAAAACMVLVQYT